MTVKFFNMTVKVEDKVSCELTTTTASLVHRRERESHSANQTQTQRTQTDMATRWGIASAGRISHHSRVSRGYARVGHAVRTNAVVSPLADRSHPAIGGVPQGSPRTHRQQCVLAHAAL